MRSVLVFLTFTSIGLSTVLAGSPDSAKTYVKEPVVVTGTRATMPARLVPSSVSTITSEALEESGGISLLDAVGEQVPGVFVTRRGVIGFGINNPAGTISIRGTGGSPNTQVLVMIDGIPQFMGIFGHPFPDTYLSENTSRVEVVRGPASVLYGTNAMGGVINIITKRESQRGLRVNGSSSYGSFTTQEYNAGVGYGSGLFDILVSAGHDETAGHRPYSGYNVNNGYLNTGYEFGDNVAMRLSGNVNKFRTYDPGPASSPKIDNWVEVMRGNAGMSVDNRFREADGSVSLFYNYGDHDVFDGFHSIDRNIGVVAYENLRPIEGNTSTLGIDYRHYGGFAVNNIAHADFGKHYSDESAVYALVEQLLMTRLMLTAGLRLQQSSVYGIEAVPQVCAAWSVTGTSTLKASVSKGFRSPTIRELYLFATANPNLEPERLWNYEIGFLQSLSGGARLEITGFVARGSNLILVEGAYPNVRLVNSGRFTHRGVEFSGRIAVTRDISLDGNYSFTDPGNQTYATPRHKMYVGGSYSHGALGLHLALHEIAGLYGGDYSTNRLPNYTLLSARVSYSLRDYAVLFLSGQNLLNVSYQTVYDYPMPGRVLKAGVKLRVAAD